MLNFPSADHEGGSGPAYQQAALTTRLLARRGKSSRRCQRSKKSVSSEDVPVRLLEDRERTLKLSSADHDGGSGPAHCRAAFTTGMLASTAESCRRCCW